MDANKLGRTSEEIYRRAVEVIPGGVSRNTVFHKPYPYYVASASGCYIKDIDGVERIDFNNNMSSLIHGHAHPVVLKAVKEQIDRGTAYTMATEVEMEYASLMVERASGFDKVRFVNSGTEAVMAMIKASRAYTGRPKIAKAEGAYHGTYDYAEVSQIAGPDNWGDVDSPNSVPVAHGTPKGALDDVLIFPFNDIERTLAILNRHADQIACVLIDPVPHRVGFMPATAEFIEAVHKWTRENGALLVFDEVVTFRVNYGGAQEGYSVRPDMTAMGEVIGGGFPIGAFAGRADIMKVLDPRESTLLLPHSGTFSANPVSMTAGKAVMEMFDREAISKINALAASARERCEEAIKIADVPVSITGAGSMFRFHLKETAPTNYREAYQPKEEKALINEMLDYVFLEQKILLINTCACMFSTVMTEKEVDRLVEAMLGAFRFIKPKLDKLR